jgi:sulfopyruvate decarboxylase subunit beta
VRRLAALEVIDEQVGPNPLVVTCGATARELASLVRRPNHLHLLDSMGLAAAVGAGVALGHPGRVTAIEGDGSLLMGLGVLATLATVRPDNLTLVVLDNGEHASAGHIPTQAATIDLAAAIRGFGLPVEEVNYPGGLRGALDAAAEGGRLAVVHARIEPGNAPDTPFLHEDPATIADGFRRALAAE